MSTTTVFEVPDTPMLDYAPDADFSMEVGHSPQWLSVEATMSDEQILSATDYSEPIEVDMEPTGDEEITEYEMADGEGEFDADGDAELEDVEVVDRSHVGSPLVVSVVPSPQPTHTPLLEHPPALSDTSLHPPVLFHSSASPVSPLEQNQHHPATLETTPSHASFLENATEQGPQTLSEAPSALQEQEDTPAHIKVTHDAPDLAVTVSELSAAPSSDNDPASFEQHVETHIEHAHVGSVPPTDPTGQEHPTGEVSKQEVATVVIESSETSVPLLVQAAHEEVDESPTDDPHEISDGVYIDPPPAVLLTLSSSTGLVDCSLFNQPYSGSGSQTPNAYASTSSPPSLALLLSQRPTLYYEPLTHVFNALREEEAIFSVAELAEGELVIEAFDLDLKIPEDNVYAREVTLHELNILHDGIDLSGPLRLRLSANPRFVTRYHALREQISQLSIGLDAGHLAHGEHVEHVEQQGASESHDDASTPELEGHASSEDAEALAVSEETEVTANQSLEPQNEEQLHVEEQPPEEPDAGVGDAQADVEETSGDLEAPSTESVPQFDQLEQEEHADTTDQAADTVGLQASEVVTEDGAEVTTKETTEHLDADDTHRAADAEEGGDYTDYAEHVEDDDEAFGEDLPEELGGNDDEEGSQQETLDDEEASDDQESDQHAEDEESGEPTADTESHQAELPSAAADVSSTADDTAHISSTANSDNIGDVNSVTNKDAASDADRLNADVDEFDNFEDYEDEDADNLSHDNPDDFEEADASQLESPQDDVAQDTASKYSSETLSSHSKRSRDEDDEEEGGVDESPGPKRVKTH